MTMNRSWRSAWFMTILVAGAGLACRDAPTATGADDARFTLSETDAALLQVGIDDARNRLLPALGTEAARQGLAAPLDALAAALRARDARELRSALSRAETAVHGLAADSDSTAAAVSGSDPELEVVRLVLDNARILIARH